MSEPIIHSLLDVDFYKFTMAQLAWRYFRNVPVRYAFKNRTKGVVLPEFISEADLRKELEHIQGLRFVDDELAYLRESLFVPRGLFKDDFLEFLSMMRLSDVTVAHDAASYHIEVDGNWPEAILWETMILAVVNELYNRSLLGKMEDCDAVFDEGNRRLEEKIRLLERYPDIRIVEFGTRRRFGGPWQKMVTHKLRDRISAQLLGTSNVLLAKQLGLRPIGTFAHEMFMVFSGIFHENLRASQRKVLEMWWQEYGEPLSVALTDTYGTDAFFRDFAPEQARLWRGLRQDSGDPVAFGEKAIAFYKRFGIDPRTKLIIFSDGLDVGMIVKLFTHFNGRIKVAFGWGTNLTNDVGAPALSLVVKVIKACGYGTVKLSDNPAKMMGDPEDVQYFMQEFGYTTSDKVYTECTY